MAENSLFREKTRLFLFLATKKVLIPYVSSSSFTTELIIIIKVGCDIKKSYCVILLFFDEYALCNTRPHQV